MAIDDYSGAEKSVESQHYPLPPEGENRSVISRPIFCRTYSLCFSIKGTESRSEGLTVPL